MTRLQGTGMSGNTLGFLLEDATFYIHTSNQHEVARFGGGGSNTNVRIYTDNQSNGGFVITAHRDANQIYPSMIIQGSHLSSPSFYVQGSTGYVGINTDHPRMAMEVHGDFFLDGQLIQRGSNQIIVSEVLQSTTLYANVVQSCNVDKLIDFTASTLSNVSTLVTKELKVEGLSITHDMDGMRCKEVAGGQHIISTVGTHELGYTISWDGGGTFTELDMVEVSGVCYGAGSGTRLHHRFNCMINPTNAVAQGLPGLDVVAEQTSMSGPGITTQPKVRVVRVSSNSVRVTSRWTASTVGYRVSMKLDVFAPIGLGNISCVSYVL